MKEFMSLSTNSGAPFFYWLTRWRACFNCLVDAGPTKTTDLRLRQERNVIERIEQAVKVVHSLQQDAKLLLNKELLAPVSIGLWH